MVNLTLIVAVEYDSKLTRSAFEQLLKDSNKKEMESFISEKVIQCLSLGYDLNELSIKITLEKKDVYVLKVCVENPYGEFACQDFLFCQSTNPTYTKAQNELILAIKGIEVNLEEQIFKEWLRGDMNNFSCGID